MMLAPERRNRMAPLSTRIVGSKKGSEIGGESVSGGDEEEVRDVNINP